MTVGDMVWVCRKKGEISYHVYQTEPKDYNEYITVVKKVVLP